MRRLALAILVIAATCRILRADQAPATQPIANWGQAVEGVRAGLRIERIVFQSGETPRFKAAIRNEGTLDLFIARTQILCEIEIDGKWHRWIGDVDVKSSPLGRGQEYDNIAIVLEPQWSPVEDGGKLKLEAGKHLLRVAFFPESLAHAQRHIKVISNVVAFELAR